jgi:ribosome biogenesis GTPase / thiamine phosphate phosphatase
MCDLTTAARGPRARAERRRAEKAERRRLEAAEAFAISDAAMDDLTDPTPTNLTDTALGTPPRASLATSTQASHAEPAHTTSTDQDDPAAGLAQVGLVAGIQRGGELSVLLDAATHRAKLSRELLQRQVAVAVGDRVRLVQEHDDRQTVIGIEPRRTRLARIREDRTRRSGFGREEAVLAANVDVAVIVAAVAQPPFHPKLVDRFLVICQYGGIRPVLCLNKCDLVGEPPDVSIYEQLGLPIVYASAATGAGLDELRSVLRGTIAVFTGHSGVGKSSLANALLGEDLLAVGAVRGANGRGRHTTTASTLLQWDASSFVVDTPGVRSLGIWKIDPTTLGWYFPELDAFSPACRFSGCSHTHEPACAVKDASEAGEIPRQRYESYLRMMDG